MCMCLSVKRLTFLNMLICMAFMYDDHCICETDRKRVIKNHEEKKTLYPYHTNHTNNEEERERIIS